MAHIASASREQDICVFVGRFQPIHSGHLGVINKALECADNLIIIVGSTNQPRRPDSNPFFFEERKQMIMGCLPQEVHSRVRVIPMEDSIYSLTEWTENVSRAVTNVAKLISNKSDPKIALIGHAKDKTSFYLKLFPQWNSIDVVSSRESRDGRMLRQLDATHIRDAYFDSDNDVVDSMFDYRLENGDLPVSVANWLRDFQKTDSYKDMVAEKAFCDRARNTFNKESYPFSRNTVTGDALVLHSSHVLLIRRGQRPGKGLWALPGGHLNIDETVMECAIREGYEETGIKVPRIIFEKSFVGQDYFDAPRRDPRGRYITHVFMFNLQSTVPSYDTTKSAAENKRRVKEALAPPKVKGMDDADKAKWVHLSELDRSQMFLDHYAIIRKMTAKFSEN